MHMNWLRTSAKVAAFTCLTCSLWFALPVANAQKTSHRGHPVEHVARISALQARKIALKRYPGRVVGKVALENEEGVWQYSVMVRSGKTLREVMVNAKTGRIDQVEVTTAAKEQAEAKADKAKGHRHNSVPNKKR